MKRSTGPLLISFLTVTAVFAGCSDDPPPQAFTPVGGSSGASSGGTNAGTGGTPVAGSFNMAGTDAGGTAGSGGDTGGTAGSGGGVGGMAGTAGTTAGTGGTPPEPVDPTIVIIDNVRLQLKPGVVEGGGGAGGEGGAGGAGVGGEPGIGGDPGIGGEPGIGGAPIGGAGGAGGASDPGIIITEPGLNGFFSPFDANITPFAFNAGGFSPNPGGSGGPQNFQALSMVAFDATGGHPGGAIKLTLPFTTATQQADVAGNWAIARDLTGYELYAEVKLVSSGFSEECISTWAYVYGGNGYANDKTGEPATLTTQHLVKDEWVVVRLDLDGPYGFHTTPTFNPGAIQIYGFQVNTWGCP